MVANIQINFNTLISYIMTTTIIAWFQTDTNVVRLEEQTGSRYRYCVTNEFVGERTRHESHTLQTAKETFMYLYHMMRPNVLPR